jgi:hypothetical protein
MKTVALILATAAALATTQVHAYSPMSDSNGDGRYSFAEVHAAYPNVTQRSFTESDLNGDGYLSQHELTAAQNRGVVTDGDAGKH